MWTRNPTRPAWRACRQPYSFYHDFIEKYWAGGPSEASAAPIHRLCTLARKMGATSFIVDDCLTRPDVAEEIAHLESLMTCGGVVTASTITFLAKGKRRDRDAGKITSADVIGQICIITFPCEKARKSYIYEAIFRLPCKGLANEQLLNNHVPISSQHEITLRGVTHRFAASYFCQQNGISSICAHSAVRTLVRTLKGQHVATCELNSFWKYDPDTRPVSTDKVEAALRHYGFRPVLYDLTTSARTVSDYPPDNVWGLLTLLADSGSPCLLTLSEGEPADHVVPILGHTFNSDEWHPLGTTLHRQGEDTISSSHLWIDHLVIHDDMLGPYFCLSRAGLFAGQNKKKLTPQLVIAMLPDQVEVSPAQAEDFARQVLSRVLTIVQASALGGGKWWDYLMTMHERRVFRTTLIEREEYLASLARKPDEVGGQQDDARRAILDRMAASLPERMWMCEITLPNLLLANRAKLGEFIIDAREFPSERDDLLSCLRAVRLPSMIAWRESQENGQSQLVGTEWDVTGHTPIHAPHHHSNWW